MTEFSREAMAGQGAGVTLKACKPSVKFHTSGPFCACSDLYKMLFDDVTKEVASRAGMFSLVWLTATLIGRKVVKHLHNNGEINCFTYRKCKDMANDVPKFMIPMLITPVLRYNDILPFRSPYLSFALLVGGWTLNTTGYVLLISTKDETYRKMFVRSSYYMLAGSAVTWLIAALTRRKACCC